MRNRREEQIKSETDRFSENENTQNRSQQFSIFNYQIYVYNI
jgi:hypothetical protein